jgi:hypothetical protein
LDLNKKRTKWGKPPDSRYVSLGLKPIPGAYRAADGIISPARLPPIPLALRAEI